MNEPNTINTEKRGWRNATFEGQMNKLLPKACDKVSNWVTQWKVESRRVKKLSRYGLLVIWGAQSNLDELLWRVQAESLVYPFQTRHPATGRLHVREANGRTADFEGCCSGIKLWTKTHVAITLLKMPSVTCPVCSTQLKELLCVSRRGQESYAIVERLLLTKISYLSTRVSNQLFHLRKAWRRKQKWGYK